MKCYIEKLEAALKMYVGDPILQRIKDDPNNALLVNKEIIEATMMFIDIRGFTRMSKEIVSGKLLEYLNIYLEKMSEIILRNNGYVDSFIGDGIFAVFGITQENHANDACHSAIECIQSMEDLNGKGLSNVSIDIGIGINTGRVSLGNIGSKFKLKFTVMGDMVNMASRMEGLTSKYKKSIIISEYTRNQISESFRTREIEHLSVKGLDNSLTIYSLEE